jgi:hypothetical protein
LDGNTFEELLAAADERMYRDKAGRRSRNSGLTLRRATSAPERQPLHESKSPSYRS